MEDLLKRLSQIKKELSNSRLPKYKRVVRAIKCLGGLELKNVTKDARILLEQSLSQLNRIVNGYEIQTFDDYEKISDRDINNMIQIQIKMCNEIKALHSV